MQFCAFLLNVGLDKDELIPLSCLCDEHKWKARRKLDKLQGGSTGKQHTWLGPNIRKSSFFLKFTDKHIIFVCLIHAEPKMKKQVGVSTLCQKL